MEEACERLFKMAGIAMPPGGFEELRPERGAFGLSNATPFQQIVNSNEFQSWIRFSSPEVRRDVAFIDDIFEKAKNTPGFDWEKSSYSTWAKRDLHWRVIIKFIAAYESTDPCDMMMETENEPDMSEWYERLIKTEGLDDFFKETAIYGRLLYFYIDYDQDHDGRDEKELGEVFWLQKQLVELKPTFGNFVYIAITCKRLRK